MTGQPASSTRTTGLDWRNPVHLVAFGFGAGALRPAPGTAGTLVGIPLFLLMQPLPAAWYLAVFALLFVIGIPLCGRTAADLGVPDHGGIVWDEILGFLATMFLAPPGWPWIVAGFILFRLFDILKPWPIGWVDRKVHGGLGIMLDDLLAALMAWVVLQSLAYWLVGS